MFGGGGHNQPTSTPRDASFKVFKLHYHVDSSYFHLFPSDGHTLALGRRNDCVLLGASGVANRQTMAKCKQRGRHVRSAHRLVLRCLDIITDGAISFPLHYELRPSIARQMGRRGRSSSQFVPEIKPRKINKKRIRRRRRRSLCGLLYLVANKR